MNVLTDQVPRTMGEKTPYGWCRRPSSTGARVHVLVLNYNGSDLLGRCLPRIVRSAKRACGEAVVTVVDNDSSDGSRDLVLGAFPDVGLYRAQNRGLASLNQVVATVPEPMVALCNNDIHPCPETFERLVQVLEASPDAFAAAPRVRAANGGTYEGPRARLRFRRGILHTELAPNEAHGSGGISLVPSAGVVLLVWRHKFLALGGFSEAYFPGRFEDLELCWRAWRAGWPVLAVEDVSVEHLGSVTFRREVAPLRLRCLDTRNALLCTLRNVRSPVRLASCLLWATLRLGIALCRANLAQATSLCQGLALGLFSRNRWPTSLRRRPEHVLLRVLGMGETACTPLPAELRTGRSDLGVGGPRPCAGEARTGAAQESASGLGGELPWAA